jgi:glycosyltransferase involved in cell wall biosynthesis
MTNRRLKWTTLKGVNLLTPDLKHMRIGIDARLYGSLGKGLGRYASELIAHLEKIDHENEYVVFLRKDNFDQYEPKNPNFSKQLAEYPWYGWKEQLIYPFFLRKFSLDLIHFPHFNVPMLYRKPFLVTVHDLILLKHPTARATTLGPLMFRLKFLVYRLVIASALKRANGILTVSETAKKEIQEHFSFTRQKQILVTYGACSPSFTANEQGKMTEKVKALKAPFALYVGNAYPHKNLERLIRGFQAFRSRGHEAHYLVLVGQEDYFYTRLKNEAAKTGDDENVVFFGHATDSELAEIYRKASFYVFPSLHEGFGLPPLEAMCKGLPVASSNASCMPEILGEAAHYFDATDSDSIANAMEKMSMDETLRERLKSEGLNRTKRYDWDITARKTLDLYGKCLS